MRFRSQLLIGLFASCIAATAAIPQARTPARVRIPPKFAEGLVVKKVPPEYPAEAKRDRIEGAVLVHVVISKAGDVVYSALVSGPPALAPAAIEAVKHWKFKPYLLNGEPIEVDTQIQVNFTLSGN
jgi:protein TonB